MSRSRKGQERITPAISQLARPHDSHQRSTNTVGDDASPVRVV
jgi:hypothetical protein